MGMTRIRMALMTMLFCLFLWVLPACAEETESELAACAGEAESELPKAAQEECVGIISAMESEISLLLENADIDHVDSVGGMKFHTGKLCGTPVVIVKAGIGKVRSAAGAATLINLYHPSRIIFTGIAGGVGDETEVLDVVVATDLVEHDYGMISNDGFKWLDEYGGENGHIDCDPDLVSLAYDCAAQAVGEDHVFRGTIVTGDQFIASEQYVEKLQKDFNALACEMEGASVAAVSSNYDVPFVVIRSMSDKADGLAHESLENMGFIAADNSCRIVMKMLENLQDGTDS